MSDAGLSYQPANLVVGDNLTLAKQWTKIDISGQPVTRYLGDWIYAALPLSQQSLFEDYYNAVQQLENKFPQGSTCWVINKHIIKITLVFLAMEQHLFMLTLILQRLLLGLGEL